MLSPSTPESLYEAIAGVVGAAGGIVSTEKLNGVTVPLAFGASSFPVRTCGPSDRGTDGTMHTFDFVSDPNVPIATPSMKIRYDEWLPSPYRRTSGSEVEIVPGSRPSGVPCPHVPSSNCAWFSTHAKA